VLQTPDVGATRVRFYNPEDKKNGIIEFSNYVITLNEVGWNGTFVSFYIRKK